MAKYERRIRGNMNELLDCLHQDIINGSASASYEDGSDLTIGDVKLAVRVYERYSMAGGNRVSMNITILAKGDDIFLSSITSGGSQAMFFKMNTWGEDSFLEVCEESVENYIRNHQ